MKLCEFADLKYMKPPKIQEKEDLIMILPTLHVFEVHLRVGRFVRKMRV